MNWQRYTATIVVVVIYASNMAVIKITTTIKAAGAVFTHFACANGKYGYFSFTEKNKIVYQTLFYNVLYLFSIKQMFFGNCCA